MTEEAVQQIVTRHMAAENPFTGEPMYTKMDAYIQQTVIDRCTIYEPYLNEQTGKWDFRKVDMKYEDLHDLGMMLLSHLESTTFYDEKEANLVWREWKSTVYLPKRCKYRGLNDMDALDILDNIHKVRRRQVFGDAKDGRRQVYDVKMAGSYRQIDVTTPGQGGGGILDRLRGRS